MNRHSRRRTAGFTLALSLLLLPAATAPAAVTIGPPSLMNLTGVDTCKTVGNCMVVNERIPGASARADRSGVITRWRVRGDGVFQLFAGFYLDDDIFTRDKASTAREAFATDVVSTFVSHVPVVIGQHIGLIAHRDAIVAYKGNLVGADADVWEPDPGVGNGALATRRDYKLMMAFNADIEPDADRDTWGDETQDDCPTDASTRSPCGTTLPPPPVPGEDPAPAPAQPGPAPPPAVADTTPPSFVSPRFERSRRRFRAARVGTLSFSLSEPASVTIVLQRRSGTRYRHVATIHCDGGLVPTRVTLRRRVRGVRLRPGHYRAVLEAVDSARNAAPPVGVRFRVRRR